MKNLSKESLRYSNLSQFGTGLGRTMYQYLSVSFYCTMARYYAITGLNFGFQRWSRSHSSIIHSLPPLVSVLYTVGWWTHSVFSIARAIIKQENPELLASFRDTFWRVPSSTHLVSLVFMTKTIS
ncbi:hypothetical protein M405DRAFT_99033 [Rhizopogon salebrosus TDB-379]|nr:hypothetical protein M405DRAFT_99033 [Rhizopogon salebrosus TDB-379]